MNWRYNLRCDDCRRFMRVEPGCAWEACGEFGEDVRYVCLTCVQKPDFTPTASNGSRDPRWCGYVKTPSSTTREPAGVNSAPGGVAG